MNNFAIVSDSCCDLDKGMREEYGIDYVPMYVSASGGSAPASLD